MVNTDLFNFKFVDRSDERQIMEKYILENNTEKILWIHGESGVGKTELVKYFKAKFPIYTFIHANPVKGQITNYFCTLIKELEKERLSFSNFIIKNYKQIKELVKDTVSEINGNAKLLINTWDVVEKVFIDKNAEFYSTADVLTKYITNISKKHSLIFIFDNFQQCDTSSLEVIKKISKNFLGNNSIKFIFITTDNEALSDSEIIRFLIEKIPNYPIWVKPFTDKKFFLYILLDIYKLDNIPEYQLDYLFQICKGNPEKLKNFLRNMYLSNGIECYNDNSSASFIPKAFKDTLETGVENIDLSSLSILEKLIFKIVICWNESIQIIMLKEVVSFIAHEIFNLPDSLNYELYNSIYKLMNLNILELNENGLKIKHDLLYISYDNKCNIIPEKIFYNKMYEYINCKKNEIIKTYSLTFFDLTNSLYSYHAQNCSWKQINLNCLRKLIEQSNYYNINAIIERLSTVYDQITASDLILIAECFYNNGKYERARNALNSASAKLSCDNEYFKYYYLSGKIYNIIMDKNNAEKEFKLASNYVTDKSEEEILVKHMRQLVLVEIPERKQEAQDIFFSISEHLENYDQNSRAIGILLKNCSNYYSGEAALNLLNKALTISEINNDLVEKAFIKNNMGYEFFKLNNYDKCKKLYKESQDILNQTKIHESAYPLSNLSVCYMLEQKYDEAINLIKLADFWNCSSYLDFVLKTHLMLCYEQTGEKENSFKLANELLDKVENGNINDPVILRKVYLNLAINFDRLESPQLSKLCIEKAYNLCIDSSSEYRASKLYKKYCGIPIKDLSKLKDQYCTKCYFDHWLTIFSHD